MEHYLLEKSRIVSHVTGERNYHIFYCLLAGLNNEEKKAIDLHGQPKDYFYLNQVLIIITSWFNNQFNRSALEV